MKPTNRIIAILICFVALSCSAKPSILIVGSAGSDHMAGPKPFLIDPVLEGKMKEQGFKVATSFYADLTIETLKMFNVVVLVQEAVLDTKSPEPYNIYREKLPLLKDYVNMGGGLMVFFDERRYAKDWDYSINYCLEMFDAAATDEAYIESNSDNIHIFEMVPEQAAIRTSNIAEHAITEGVSELWYPRLTRVIEVSDDWDIIVRGEKSAKTEKTYTSAPPVIAVRKFGKGRIALFAGLSSFYILNGYHRTYDNGWMFNQGNGNLFFDNLYQWLSLPSSKIADMGDYDGRKLPKSDVEMGTRIETISICDTAKPQAGIIGVYTTYSGGQYTVADFARKAKELGIKFIAITDRIISQSDWESLLVDCRQASCDEFVVMPGVEFTTSWRGTERGLQGFMINGDKWPPLYGNSFISTELRTGEEHNSIVIMANPRLNTLAPWNVGGFHSLEIMSYRGSEQYSAALDWYRWYQGIPAVGWYPSVSHRVWNLRQLTLVAQRGYKNYLYSEDVKGIRHAAGEGITPGFVSNGPVITKFKTDVIMRDPWEHYYLWTPGQLCDIHVSVESDIAIRDITLYSGNDVVRRFYPNSKQFDKKVVVPIVKEGSFYLEVSDVADNNAYSYTIPTRNLTYWNHIGSDAMNDYHNPVSQDPYGDLIYDGKRYGYGGLVTFGYGWENYIRFYHPVAVTEFHPLGYESGMIPAGLANVKTYPTVWYENPDVHPGLELENALPRRSCPISTADVAVIRENVDYINNNGRMFETENFNSSADMTLFRYEYKPFGYIIMPVESKMRVKTGEGQSIRLQSRTGVEIALLTLTFQTNKHFKTVSWIDSDGKLQSEPIDLSKPETVKMLSLSGGSYITLSPDPFGQVGLFVVEGQYDVEIIGGDKPLIHIGYDMDGGKLNNGQILEGNFIVMQEGGGQGAEVCHRLYEQWGLSGKSAYEPVMKSGELLNSIYTIDMAAMPDKYGVIAEFGKVDNLANNLAPITVRGVNHRWTCAAINEQYYPTGANEEKMYVGLKTPFEGSFFIGNPVIADNENLIIEITEFHKTVSVSIHNPTDKEVISLVEANPLLTEKLFLSETISIGAGKTVRVSGKTK